MRSLYLIVLALAIGLTSACTSEKETVPAESWKQVVENDLHLLGHRNWILVVDKAFPEQSSEGMKYIYVEQDLLSTLKHVLEQVEGSTHVSPIIYRDKELDYITEEQVSGISAFRRESKSILGERDVNTLLHDEVFKLLDESSSLFTTLVIKTNCTLPYTSFFLQLDCAYWNPGQEVVLREQMSKPQTEE